MIKVKVYIAISADRYEKANILGVYESKKLAEEAIENYKENNPNETDPDCYFYDIEVHELNVFDRG